MIDDQYVFSDYVLTYLNNDNCIEFLNEDKAEPLKRVICRIGVFLKWNCICLYKKAYGLRKLLFRI